MKNIMFIFLLGLGSVGFVAACGDKESEDTAVEADASAPDSGSAEDSGGSSDTGSSED